MLSMAFLKKTNRIVMKPEQSKEVSRGEHGLPGPHGPE